MNRSVTPEINFCIRTRGVVAFPVQIAFAKQPGVNITRFVFVPFYGFTRVQVGECSFPGIELHDDEICAAEKKVPVGNVCTDAVNETTVRCKKSFETFGFGPAAAVCFQKRKIGSTIKTQQYTVFRNQLHRGCCRHRFGAYGFARDAEHAGRKQQHNCN